MSHVEQVQTRTNRANIVSVRLTQQERDTLWALAKTRGIHPSKMVRGMILDLLGGHPGSGSGSAPGPAVADAGGETVRSPAGGPAETSPPASSRSWEKEWAAMAEMEPAEAGSHFVRLSGGVTVPAGFRTWSRAAKIAWLDKECPLS